MGQWCDRAEITSHGEEVGYSSCGSGDGPWRGQALVWNIKGAGPTEGRAGRERGSGGAGIGLETGDGAGGQAKAGVGLKGRGKACEGGAALEGELERDPGWGGAWISHPDTPYPAGRLGSPARTRNGSCLACFRSVREHKEWERGDIRPRLRVQKGWSGGDTVQPPAPPPSSPPSLAHRCSVCPAD